MHILRYLLDLIPNFILSINFTKHNIFFIISLIHLHKVVFILKKHALISFKFLSDFISIDFLTINYNKRFCFLISLLSIFSNKRVFIKFLTSSMYLTSLTSYFKSAPWLEREIWDLSGIFFSNNSDLRRILTDYGFQGYPLRKDFPVTGFVEFRYNDMLKRIISLDLSLVQEFRNMEFLNPWRAV